MEGNRHSPAIEENKGIEKNKEAEMKLERYPAPSCINSIESKAEQSVASWYGNRISGRSLILAYAQRDPNGSVARMAREFNLQSRSDKFPAPPAILSPVEKKR